LIQAISAEGQKIKCTTSLAIADFKDEMLRSPFSSCFECLTSCEKLKLVFSTHFLQQTIHYGVNINISCQNSYTQPKFQLNLASPTIFPLSYAVRPAFAHAIISFPPSTFNIPSGPSQNITPPKLDNPILSTLLAIPCMPSAFPVFSYAVGPAALKAGAPI
jgi:hypothetical protein